MVGWVRALRGGPDLYGTGSLAEMPPPLALPPSADRVDIVEKRLDEEVRARMQLEERVMHMTEENKVLRDRVHRIARRSDGS